MDELPRQSRAIVNGELAESKVDLIKDCGDVQDTSTGTQGAVRLDVARGAVDKVRHGFAGVGVVCVVVNYGCFVDCTFRSLELILLLVGMKMLGDSSG